MMVTFSDINRRINKLGAPPSPFVANMREAQLYTNKGTFCENNAINSIKNWESLDENVDTAFNNALDIFEELCLNSNKSTIQSACNILVENMDKIRDPSQLANSLKYRFSRIKRKSVSSVKKVHGDVTNKIQSSIDTLQNTLKSAGVSTSNTASTQEACFNELITKCQLITECDRIIKNYSTISKRFNLDRIISNIRYDIDLYQACFEIASYVDTYNQPFKSKYNSALETTAYLFDKHFMNYPKDKIIEAVTDYFIFSGSLNENTIKDVQHIKEISVLFESKDFSSIAWLENKPINGNSTSIKLSDSYECFDEKAIGNIFKKKTKEIKQAAEDLADAAKEGNPDEHRDDDIKDMIDDFRASCMKDKDAKTNLPSFKALINKIFTKSPTQIVFEVPNLLSIIRVIFVLGVGAIHPILMVCAYLADGIINIHLSRKQLEKIIKSYNNEIDSVKNKIEKTKDNETKDRLQKYLEELKKDLKKIKEYEDNIYTDEENDKRKEDEDSDDDFDSDDFDFDDDDFDFDFEELAAIEYISTQMEMISENLIDDTVEGIVCNNIFKLDNDSIDAITDFSITVPTILEKKTLKESLCKYRNQLRKSASSTKDYIRIDCLNENILKLDKSSTPYSTSSTIKDAMYYLFCLNEISKIKLSGEYITEEMNFSNTIKLAINQLKRNVTKLSDKEKQACSAIDVAANNAAKSMEDALMTSNREAVIKGRLIPSASKCIKLAITIGTTALVSPTVAVIAALGTFACSKHLQRKERQLVLDDIEIELKMCERYLRQAEDEGDMKKVRQIEVTQRNLERQRQRIKHRMSMQITPNNLRKIRA